MTPHQERRQDLTVLLAFALVGLAILYLTVGG